jgi:hypothetical protein
MFRTGNASRRVESLYYAGSSTIPGIGLPMCLISAEILLKRLRGDHSASPLAEPLLATADGPTSDGPTPADGPVPAGKGEPWQ